MIIYNLANYTLLTYMPSYLSDSLGISDTAGLLLLFIAILVMLVVITFVGSFSDRVGRKPVLIGAMIGFVLLTCPAFLLISVGSWVSVMAGLLIFALLQVLLLGTLPPRCPRSSPQRNATADSPSPTTFRPRLSGAPLPLWRRPVSATGNQFMPAFYVMAAALVSSIPIWLMAETAKRPLRGSVSLSAVPARAQR